MAAWLPAAIQGGTALAGGLMSLLGKSKPASLEQLQRFSPEDTAAMNQLTQQGLQNMDLGAIQKEASRGFRSDIAPSIASRFASMGGGGAQRSSGFPAALAGAGSDLQSKIAAMMPQIGLQQLQLGLQPKFDWMRQPERAGFAQSLGSPMFSSGISSLLPTLNKMFGGNQEGEQNSLIKEIIAALRKQGGQSTANQPQVYEDKVNPLPSMPESALTDRKSELVNSLMPALASILSGGR